MPNGASVVLDYHQPDWSREVRRLTDGGVAAVNTVRGAAASQLPLVVNGGRLATISSDPHIASGTSRSAARMSART